MAAIFRNTLDDLRCGRQSWRVTTMLAAVAFIVTVVLRLIA